MVYFVLIDFLVYNRLLGALVLALLIATISYKFRAVSISGAIGMMIMGTIVFGFGGPIFSIPLLFFFVSSSILSAIKNSAKKNSLKVLDKTGPRDIWQVCANGGVATVCVIISFFTGDIRWFFPYLASLCEASSDTWATEIGTLFRGSPRSIITLEKVQPGQSGGISIPGSAAAILGASMTMLFTLWIEYLILPNSSFQINYWIAAANSGLAGCVLDSILGGSLQVQYYCRECSGLCERKFHCGKETQLVRGSKIINNDVVNFAGTGFAAVVAVIIIFLIC